MTSFRAAIRARGSEANLCLKLAAVSGRAAEFGPSLASVEQAPLLQAKRTRAIQDISRREAWPS